MKSHSPSTQRPARRQPLLMAIVGGSGSGKSWLAQRLAAALAPRALRLSQDDFYRDRSHLSAARRARLNFDHPRAIDWAELERVVRALRANRPVRFALYDFKTHCRSGRTRRVKPKPIILLEGLWLLRRSGLRRLFGLSVFLDCPARVRLRRRLARDLRSRGRTRASIQRQFCEQVEPMHARFVAPQAARADLVLRGCNRAAISDLLQRVRAAKRSVKPGSKSQQRGHGR